MSLSNALLVGAAVAMIFTGAASAQAPEAKLVPANTLLGTGPYKAIMEADPGLPTHTIYRPNDLAALKGEKLPIVAWGNGACSNIGNKFRWHMTEIASHGFLVVAIGPIGTPQDEAEPRPPARPPGAAAGPPSRPSGAPGGPRPAPQSRSGQLIDAIDWAVAENGRKGGKYYGKLDIAKVAVMGQSCGGVQAIEASADPRVTTSMIWNSGLMPEPGAMGGGKILTKEDLKAYHAPVAYVTGDPSDIAFKNAEDDYQRVSHVPVMHAWLQGVGHNGTHRQRDGGAFGKVSVAWLKWRLKGDGKAGKMFTGAGCGLCKTPGWTVSRKNFP